MSHGVSCNTERRAIYILAEGNKTHYKTFDFKSSTWDIPNTNITSAQAKWEIGPDEVATIHFENKEYQYRFEIGHLKSLASGTVSVFKDGNKLQSESCKLLYID